MKKLDILVCYDVNTSETDGKSRLRRVAKVCEAHGQRVQYSVFECRLTQAHYETLVTKIQEIMVPEEDSLRVYLLTGSRDQYLCVYGRDTWIDFEGPLIV
jgi:CRISPR-associated protein Cas2